MNRCYFITGTDTGIGKTVASVALLQAAQKLGFKTVGYKPVATGIQINDNGSFKYENDILTLKKYSSVKVDYEELNLYSFIESTSPHIASKNEKKPIILSKISDGLYALKLKSNWILVEGAGGWFTPLSETTTFADWVISIKLPIILVIGIKLGCINHALLTYLAINNSGLKIVGWIANSIDLSNKRYLLQYLFTLKKMLPIPFLGEIPWINNINSIYLVNKYVELGNFLNIKHLV